MTPASRRVRQAYIDALLNDARCRLGGYQIRQATLVQLQEWARMYGIPVRSQNEGRDQLRAEQPAAAAEAVGGIGDLDSDQPVQAVKLSWDEVSGLVDELVVAIGDGGWYPSLIVTVNRGGAIPGIMLAERLEVQTVVGLDSRKSLDGYLYGEYCHLINLTHEDVLVFDDATKTGRLVYTIANQTREQAKTVRTAALYWSGEGFPTDFYVRQAKAPDWPWEV